MYDNYFVRTSVASTQEPGGFQVYFLDMLTKQDSGSTQVDMLDKREEMPGVLS